jgi:DNA-binding PadR family transcriptional regulator
MIQLIEKTGLMELFVLSTINKNQCSASTLSEQAKLLFGKAPSSGTLYPLLKKLEIEAYIKRTIDTIHKFEITKKGKMRYKYLRKEIRQKMGIVSQLT